jgi:hypothetical protein
MTGVFPRNISLSGSSHVVHQGSASGAPHETRSSLNAHPLQEEHDVLSIAGPAHRAGYTSLINDATPAILPWHTKSEQSQIRQQLKALDKIDSNTSKILGQRGHDESSLVALFKNKQALEGTELSVNDIARMYVDRSGFVGLHRFFYDHEAPFAQDLAIDPNMPLPPIRAERSFESTRFFHEGQLEKTYGRRGVAEQAIRYSERILLRLDGDSQAARSLRADVNRAKSELSLAKVVESGFTELIDKKFY